VPLLRLPQPYDFELSTGRYRAFGPDVANLWHEGALYRVVDGREVRIAASAGGLEVDPLDDEISLVVLRLLGAPFDLDPFYRFAALDAVLGPIAEWLRGLRPPLAPTPLESLVTSITAQLAAAEEDELVALGFSRRKAAYVVGLARSDLDLDSLAALPDEEVKARLTALPGIGEWTADWFLARHLARPQAWPAGDLGLRKAVSAFYGDGREFSTEEVRAIGDRFEPFQNLTAHYLLTAFLLELWK
jgi:3-methyladenine DNA glycosylase/8-oxoguanine DNA glycosylase